MGWTIASGHTKAQWVKELTRDNRFSKCLTFKSVRGGLFEVREVLEDSDYAKKGDRYITVHLIERHGKELSVKSMDETMGPYFAEGCPLEFIALAGPTDKPDAISFRNRVLAYHADRSRVKNLTLTPGQKFNVARVASNLLPFTFIGKRKSSYMVEAANGQVYRLGPKFFPDIEVIG
jgi:hypothetical protein